MIPQIGQTLARISVAEIKYSNLSAESTDAIPISADRTHTDTSPNSNFTSPIWVRGFSSSSGNG
ncbi:hypothetical protein ACTXT7_015421 [Hymenolepis weldensis]